MIDLTVAFVATLAGCVALARLAPAGRRGLNGFLTARVGRMTGRAVTVLLVVAIGCGPFDGSPAEVLVGALAGWLVAVVFELRSGIPGGEGDGR